MDQLTDEELSDLHRAGLTTTLDVLCLTSNELARRLQIPDAQHITDKIAASLAPKPERVGGPGYEDPVDFIRTGDADLDVLLGGGIRTGAVWELVGESSAGKTQLALQTALMAISSRSNPTLDPSVCYLSSQRSSFPTERLVQMLDTRPALSLTGLTPRNMLDRVKFRSLDSDEDLINILSVGIPRLAEGLLLEGKQLRLIVIDALAPLVALHGRHTSADLFERRQTLNEIGSRLKNIARTYSLAVIAINEVQPVFDAPNLPSSSRFVARAAAQAGMVTYDSQLEYFSRTPKRLEDLGIIEGRMEAKLGLGWAYCIDARILLTRTNRVRHEEQVKKGTHEEGQPSSAKRRRIDPGTAGSASISAHRTSSAVTHDTSSLQLAPVPISLRHLNVLFNRFGPRASLDYVILSEGVRTVEGTPALEDLSPTVLARPRPLQTKSQPQSKRRGPGHVQGASPTSQGGIAPFPSSSALSLLPSQVDYASSSAAHSPLHHPNDDIQASALESPSPLPLPRSPPPPSTFPDSSPGSSAAPKAPGASSQYPNSNFGAQTEYTPPPQHVQEPQQQPNEADLDWAFYFPEGEGDNFSDGISELSDHPEELELQLERVNEDLAAAEREQDHELDGDDGLEFDIDLEPGRGTHEGDEDEDEERDSGAVSPTPSEAKTEAGDDDILQARGLGRTSSGRYSPTLKPARSLPH